jgi:hypothetical protein
VLLHPTARLTCIDTFAGSDEMCGDFAVAGAMRGLYKRFVRNIEATGKRNQVDIVVGRSEVELHLLEGEFDFIYVDGSHHAPDVMADALASFGLVKKGGLVLFDDYEWGHPAVPVPPRVALDAFLALLANKLEVIHRGRQLCVRKNI